MSKAEEDHARLLLSHEVGVEFRHHDDGSQPSMPDLLSTDNTHVAEVITTTSAAVREAEHRLHPISEAQLPHCVWVVIPYTMVGGATKSVRHKIKADVLRWTTKSGCVYHWSSRDERRLIPEVDPDPILGLGAYDDGIRAVCAQRCRHGDAAPHEIRWSVAHTPSTSDPWQLIRQSLRNVDKEQRGGLSALVKKLDGYPNKHIVMYPYGSPGNLTAALSGYVLPPNLHDLMPPVLNPPLARIHLWLLYKYGKDDDVEGLHLCSGHWGKFGTALPKLDRSLAVRQFHYEDA